MNILLFSPDEWNKPLGSQDSRTLHVKKILGKAPGQTLEVGCLGLGRGKAKIAQWNPEGDLILEFPLSETLTLGPPQLPVVILLGHPRIPVIQRLCRDFASFGVQIIEVCGTDRGEKSYFSSSFWSNNEARGLAIDGAQQGGLTDLPEVRRWWSLGDFFEKNPDEYSNFSRYLLHPSPEFPFFGPKISTDFSSGAPKGVFIAIGPERGWSEREVDILLQRGFEPLSLGPHIWRTETAALFAAGLGTHLYSAVQGL